MTNFTLLFSIALISLYFHMCTRLVLALDSDNLQDICPTNTTHQTIFINGFPCKNPANINPSDFKTSLLNHAGDTEHFLRSSTTIVTAADFPGLNTLGLSIARTDIEMDGIVMVHAHPRASEMFFVSKGFVVVGFIDTNGHTFQMQLKEGDVFVFPRGLLHYSVNNGLEMATAFSVLNSQNPGMVSIVDALFAHNDSGAREMLAKRLISLARSEVDPAENVTFF